MVNAFPLVIQGLLSAWKDKLEQGWLKNYTLMWYEWLCVTIWIQLSRLRCISEPFQTRRLGLGSLCVLMATTDRNMHLRRFPGWLHYAIQYSCCSSKGFPNPKWLYGVKFASSYSRNCVPGIQWQLFDVELSREPTSPVSVSPWYDWPDCGSSNPTKHPAWGGRHSSTRLLS